jgi:hypothetical protein
MNSNLLFFVTFLGLSFVMSKLALIPEARRLQAIRIRSQQKRPRS